ncbi:hypothetical protein E4T66_18255 [Sinimarinibacterium sp. CAU 1509]|uniref:endonuclease n=1 Tax=Sinimarinibacterium sp. CAU 1509 TaxID=2562283 RepID=UPI0010AC2CD1|nr:endonuclease [Sinimarinibacterium sp. CAU 1509]TJY57349.1 hypothetical protein E4T66_18255 [Sinimarinibacterium sp. CAU 1509]
MRRYALQACTFISILLAAATAGAAGGLDFETGKKVMYAVHKSHPIDLYCGCAYHGKSLDGSCPVTTPSYRERLRRVEAEHMVPASDFGRQRSCWRSAPKGTSGRNYCREVDPDFRAMEGDPHNLWPVVGALNATRSNYRFGEVPGEARNFGQCDFELSADGAGHFVEPPEAAKGVVARAYFYMERQYGQRISKSQRRVLESWARSHPPTVFEVERARAIERLTGLHNPILTP